MDEFKTRLRTAMQAKDSLVCVGLDPQPDKTKASEIIAFNRKIVEETADFVAAYKPQSAFYEAAGNEGWIALKETIDCIREKAPSVLVILDVKRGDVPNTAEACASAGFEFFGADAMTVNPYVGGDGAAPFLASPAHGAFFLCRTSNRGGSDFQSLMVSTTTGERPLYLEVARKVASWGAEHENAGAVVGATFPAEIQRVRAECPSLPLLIPGVGAQGGDLEKSVRAGLDADGFGLLVNSSRSLIYADDPRVATGRLREQINVVREKHMAASESTLVAVD